MSAKPRRIFVRFGLICCAAIVVATILTQSQGTTQPSSDKKRLPEIPENTLRSLISKAKDASKNAYCPYSNFRVGASVLTDSGEIFTGCNVENASYGLTICAERNAVFQMIAKAKHQVRAVIIYTPTAKPSAPCGACRQVINEFGPDALVVSVCDGEGVLRKSLSELLPEAFGPANLNR